ncbi:MAG: hypothetical protein LBC30_00985 [Puniceicoccales bacterium]|jgi:hypothetical protein|nr:hypothetical protein [Puniceicoccales bacterium]
MSTDDNDITGSKIDYTVEFDPNARAIKPMEEHPLYHLAKDEREGPSQDR